MVYWVMRYKKVVVCTKSFSLLRGMSLCKSMVINTECHAGTGPCSKMHTASPIMCANLFVKVFYGFLTLWAWTTLCVHNSKHSWGPFGFRPINLRCDSSGHLKSLIIIFLKHG